MSGDRSEEIDLLKESAIDSLKLAIELFNRPHPLGRKRGIPLLMGHSFEMLLKASILENDGSIHTEGDNNQTIGLKKAINICEHGDGDNSEVRILSEDDAITLRKIKNDRDSAAHYLIDSGEQQLYVFAQAAVHLFDDLLERVFDEKLSDYLPNRVLPLSTEPPESMAVLIDQEYNQIRELLDEGKRETAKARLRPIESLERALSEDEEGPITDTELEDQVDEVMDQRDWTQIFRGVATLDLTTEGATESIELRISKSEGVPVNLVSDDDVGEEDEAAVAVKRVNERDFYNLGIEKMAEKFDDITCEIQRMDSARERLL